MKYSVFVQPPALEDLEEVYLWAAQRAPQTAARWYNRFREALQTLESNPERCSLAPENSEVEPEIRQFLFGKKPNVFRVLFTIDANTVRILHIRRASRRIMTAEELSDSL
jgi:plasmid stabilization system protein ParE